MLLLRLIVALALLAQPLLATAGLRAPAPVDLSRPAACCAESCTCADACPCMAEAPADPRPTPEPAPSPRPVEVRALLAPLVSLGDLFAPRPPPLAPHPAATTRPRLSCDSLQAAFCIWTT